MVKDDSGPQLRRVLDTRQRQSLINDHERAWLSALKSKGFDAGRHPFLDAGNSEATEARFFEALRRGVPYERNATVDELSALAFSLSALPEAILERAAVVFSPAPGALGAFVSSFREVLPKLEGIAEYARYELGIMTVDAAHGLSIERNAYREDGSLAEHGILLIRAWGDLVPPDAL